MTCSRAVSHPGYRQNAQQGRSLVNLGSLWTLARKRGRGTKKGPLRSGPWGMERIQEASRLSLFLSLFLCGHQLVYLLSKGLWSCRPSNAIRCGISAAAPICSINGWRCQAFFCECWKCAGGGSAAAGDSRPWRSEAVRSAARLRGKAAVRFRAEICSRAGSRRAGTPGPRPEVR